MYLMNSIWMGNIYAVGGHSNHCGFITNKFTQVKVIDMITGIHGKTSCYPPPSLSLIYIQNKCALSLFSVN